MSDNVKPMKFRFIGKLKFDTKEDAKVPFLTTIENDNGKGYKIKGTLASARNNTSIVEMFGWKSADGIIKTKDTDNENIEILWKNRNDPEIVKKVSLSRKISVNIGDEQNQFITAYDACRFIADNVDEFNEGRYYLTGNVSRSWKDGKEYTSFNINNIYQLKEDDDRKNKLNITTTFYWTKDSIDLTDAKSEGKIYVEGYIPYYIKEAKKKMYIPQKIVINCKNIDSEDEQKKTTVEMKLEEMGIIYKDGKFKVTLKSNTYYAHNVVLKYIHGAAKADDVDEITMETLTPKQRKWIATGLYTLDDFKSSSAAYGDFVTEYHLLKFDTKDLEKDLEPINISYEDFEENIYVPNQNFTSMNKPVDDEEEDEEEPRKVKKKVIDDDDDDDNPVPKKSTKKKASTVDDDDEDDDDDDDKLPFDIDDDDEPKPKKKAKVKSEEPLLDTDEDEDEDEEEPKPKSKPKKSDAKPKKTVEDEDDDDEDDDDLESLFD